MTAQSGNIMFLWDTPDLAEAMLTVDPPAAEDPDWPATHLADTFRSVAAKCTGGAKINIDFGAPVYISALALVDLVCAPETVVTVTAWDDAFVTPAVTHQFWAGQPIMLWGDGVWGDGIWNGYADDDDLYGNQPRVELIDTAGHAYRYWTVEVAESGPWSLGRLILGDYFRPDNNFLWGWRYTSLDQSALEYSPGGAPLSDAAEPVGQVEFGFDRLSAAEAFGAMLQMARRVGKRRDMVLIMTPEDVTLRPITTIYGRFTDSIQNFNPAVAIYAAEKIVFRESL